MSASDLWWDRDAARSLLLERLGAIAPGRDDAAIAADPDVIAAQAAYDAAHAAWVAAGMPSP